MVEFALVLPILCLLLFGVIQFGILYNNYVSMTDAARAGARRRAVSRQRPVRPGRRGEAGGMPPTSTRRSSTVLVGALPVGSTATT